MRAAFALVLLSLAGCPETVDPPDGGGPTSWAPTFDAASAGWLLNTWGPSPDDLYAVGGTAAKGAVMHFDGTRWSPVTLGVDTPLLNWSFGFGAKDVTIVGAAGTVLHWDGQAWTKQAAPTTQDLWGVWGAAPDDLWAVGGGGLAAGQATLLHYDGATWTSQVLPALQRPNVWQLLKVWGTSAENVYVVGQRGVVLHFSAGAWKEELVGASDDLVSLWGTGPDHIVAVGGRSNGIASVWNGTSWHTESLAPLPGLNGVWMRTPGKAHIAGAYGTLGVLDLATLQVTTADPGTKLDFHSVFGDTQGHLYAVGGNLASANPATYVGLAYTRVLGAEE